MSRRSARATFAALAPRLEQAHRERRAELQREQAARIRAAGAVLKAKRLVAHRELQLARGELKALAGVGRSANHRRHRDRYVDLRSDKLAEARRALADAEAHARQLGL